MTALFDGLKAQAHAAVDDAIAAAVKRDADGARTALGAVHDAVSALLYNAVAHREHDKHLRLVRGDS